LLEIAGPKGACFHEVLMRTARLRANSLSG
jgi:hypothetical protein